MVDKFIVTFPDPDPRFAKARLDWTAYRKHRLELIFPEATVELVEEVKMPPAKEE